MTDPAVAAAKRALGTDASIEFLSDSTTWLTISAAVEALKPIRELHQSEPYAQGPDYCAECEHRWPCDTAKLIYPESELYKTEETT